MMTSPDGAGGHLRQLESFELHLDGAVLRRSFDSMVESADQLDGIESLIDALSVKSALFARTFASAENLILPELLDACAFVPTVRRRLKLALQQYGFDHIKSAIASLLVGLTIENADRRIREMSDAFPITKQYRWVRDLAAEIMHFREPDTYPLMTRWVWDRVSNTGVLREIWYEEFRDNRLDIDDTIEVHLTLREELTGFLRNDGVYANIPFMIDLLYAWVYGEYIGSQGGSFLKTDFTQSSSPLGYAIRMLGLDGACDKSGKTRLIMPDGKRYVLSNIVDTATH